MGRHITVCQRSYNDLRSDPKMIIKVLVTRHAEAPRNSPGSPPTEDDLTPLGRDQARQLGDHLQAVAGGLPILASYASSKRRARSTQAIALQQCTIEEGVKAMSWALFDELTAGEVQQQAQTRGAEATEALKAVVSKLGRQWAAANENGPPRIVAIFSHGRLIRHMLRYMESRNVEMPDNFNGHDMALPDNASITTILCRADESGEVQWAVSQVGSTDHLVQDDGGWF